MFWSFLKYISKKTKKNKKQQKQTTKKTKKKKKDKQSNKQIMKNCGCYLNVFPDLKTFLESLSTHIIFLRAQHGDLPNNKNSA